MKKLSVISFLLLSACASEYQFGPGTEVGSVTTTHPVPVVDSTTYFPVASATINVATIDQLALTKPSVLEKLLIPMAYAQVAQGSATVSVVYTNPGATTFTVNTASLGSAITVVGDDLNLGSVSVSGLDDNSIRVCTGVGAPSNRCNRLYIRVYTLGTATGVTGTAGFINTGGGYGIDVFAGSVVTPIGFNASATASTVSGAATVYTYTIPNGLNRVRLSQLSIPSIPIKADLSNAGSGTYEMNLVIQYALGYVP